MNRVDYDVDFVQFTKKSGFPDSANTFGVKGVERKRLERGRIKRVFMSWCLNFFCAVGALCVFSYF